MQQVIYISESRVGDDVSALDRIMVQARANNAVDGITGLLWTDGARFAQVVEGDESAIADLMDRLRADRRHSNLEIVRVISIDAREYGGWSMARPSNDPLAKTYEIRMLSELAVMTQALGAEMRAIIVGSGLATSP